MNRDFLTRKNLKKNNFYFNLKTIKPSNSNSQLFIKHLKQILLLFLINAEILKINSQKSTFIITNFERRYYLLNCFN